MIGQNPNRDRLVIKLSGVVFAGWFFYEVMRTPDIVDGSTIVPWLILWLAVCCATAGLMWTLLVTGAFVILGRFNGNAVTKLTPKQKFENRLFNFLTVLAAIGFYAGIVIVTPVPSLTEAELASGLSTDSRDFYAALVYVSVAFAFVLVYGLKRKIQKLSAKTSPNNKNSET